ncbi:MAG: hypothetical protein ABFS35_22625 [Bacteroidota bacterium]
MANCIHGHCTLEVFDKNEQTCIFHCKKDDWFTQNDKKQKTWNKDKLNLFWDQLNKRRLAKGLKENSSILSTVTQTGNGTNENFIEINGIVIPPLNSIDNFHKDIQYYRFSNCTFIDSFVIELDHKSTNLEKDFYFSQCTFKGKFQVKSNNSGVDGSIILTGTKHHNNICFEGDYFKTIHINNINFKEFHDTEIEILFEPSLIIRHMTFENIIFSHLDRARIKGISFLCTNINNIIFSETIDSCVNMEYFKIYKSVVNKCKIAHLNLNEFKIKNTTFSDHAQVYLTDIQTNDFIIDDLSQQWEFMKLNKVSVNNKFECRNSTFNNTVFDNVNLSKAQSIYIFNTSFIGSLQSHIKWGNINKIHSTKEIFRQLKFLNDRQGNHIDANKFYSMELQTYNKELKWWKNPLKKLTLWIHRISSNHSQNWALALFWIVTISAFKVYISSDNDTTFKLENYINKMVQTFNFLDISKENFSVSDLLYKIILGYLIYQFIISIRNETKRK